MCVVVCWPQGPVFGARWSSLIFNPLFTSFSLSEKKVFFFHLINKQKLFFPLRICIFFLDQLEIERKRERERREKTRGLKLHLCLVSWCDQTQENLMPKIPVSMLSLGIGPYTIETIERIVIDLISPSIILIANSFINNFIHFALIFDSEFIFSFFFGIVIVLSVEWMILFSSENLFVCVCSDCKGAFL